MAFLRLILVSAILVIGGLLFVANYSPEETPGAPVPRVLFVGNSLTMGHNVPGRMANKALEDGVRVDVRMLARGGAYLKDWADDPQLIDALTNGNWDVVVLQDNSKAALKMEFRLASRQAVSKIALMAGDARLVLSSTWPAAEGHAIYSDDWWGRDKPENPKQFADRTAQHYQNVGVDLGIQVAPITEVWMQSPDRIELYHPDKVHASAQGADLAAAVLWMTIRQALD